MKIDENRLKSEGCKLITEHWTLPTARDGSGSLPNFCRWVNGAWRAREVSPVQVPLNPGKRR